MRIFNLASLLPKFAVKISLQAGTPSRRYRSCVHPPVFASDDTLGCVLEKSKSRGSDRKGPGRPTSSSRFRFRRTMVAAAASFLLSSSSSPSSPFSSTSRLFYIAIAHSQQPCHYHEAILHAGWLIYTLSGMSLLALRARDSLMLRHKASNVRPLFPHRPSLHHPHPVFPSISVHIQRRWNVSFSLWRSSREITRPRSQHLIITCLCVSLQLTWVFHDDEAQINKKLPKELLLRYE